MDEETKSNMFIEAFAGSVGAAVTGLSVGAGVEPISSGIIGNFLGNGIKSIYTDVIHRQLTSKESKRVNAVADRIVARISERLKSGEKPRRDGFFNSDVNGYCNGAEVFEGVLLAAKGQYEERKLPYLSNFYCNIAFNTRVSSTLANQMLKLFDVMSYQQLVILGVLGDLDKRKISLNRKDIAYDNIKGANSIAVVLDVFKLYNETYITDSRNQMILDAYAIEPVYLILSSIGMLFYELCGLNNINDEEAKSVVYDYLEGKDSEIDDAISGNRRRATWGSF